MRRTWEFGINTFPIAWVIYSNQISIYCILHPMGNACVFPSICITWEKAAKSIEWREPGKLVPGNIVQNRSYWENLGNYTTVQVPFPLESHRMVYFITWEMHVFVHQIFGRIRKVSKTHQMGKPWESGSHTFYKKWVVFPLFSHPVVYFIIC